MLKTATITSLAEEKIGIPEDTWLLFEAPRVISAAELVKEGVKGNIAAVGQLRPDIANAICNCMKRCDDVSEIHVQLLGPPAQR